jgi:type I restriction enzyme, S subunit
MPYGGGPVQRDMGASLGATEVKELDYTSSKLPDVVYFQEGPGVRKWDFHEDGTRIMNIRLIRSDGTLDVSDSRFVSNEFAFGKWKHFLLDEDDIIVSSSGSIGKRAWVRKQDLPLMLNTSVIRFRPIDESVIDRRYLWHYLGSNHFLEQIHRMKTGTAQVNFGPSHLKNVDIDYPNIIEQRRIAAILDKAEQTMQSSIRSLNSKSSLITSTFIEMFGDSLTNPKNWKMKSLGELGLHISDGNYSAKYPKVDDFVEEGVPFLRANNLKKWSVNDKDMRYIRTELHKNVLLKGHVKVNDILITTRGNIGQVGIVPKRHHDSNINAQLVLLRTEGSEIHHHYLLSVLDSEGLQHQFRKLQTGTALKQLPVSKLRKAVIPVPPMDLQISFSNLFKQMDSQISNAHIELESLKALFSSLVQDLIA